MNDFENDLKSQPIRRLPDHWRAQILQQASERTLKRELQPWWVALLWPSPKAWGTLAITWFVIIGFSIANRESSAPEEKPQAAQIRIAMEEKRRLQSEIEEASVRLEQQPKPRSERIGQSKSV